MSIQKPINIPGRRKVITKNMILRAQGETSSNMAASRWLEVSYNTYKKWAKYYGVFERLKNQAGVGIKKGLGNRDQIVRHPKSDNPDHWINKREAKKYSKYMDENDEPLFGSSCYWIAIPEGKDLDEFVERWGKHINKILRRSCFTWTWRFILSNRRNEKKRSINLLDFI